MAHMIGSADAAHASTVARDRVGPAFQAFRILHVGFVVAPTIAGLDKFLHLLTNWDRYLAPSIARLSPIGGHGLMLVVGVVEILAGLLVALRPRLGGYVVALWLWGIIANLVLARGFYDVALRDFGLSLGALALAPLATAFDRAPHRREVLMPREA
jgi:hypothetical protein